MRRRTGIAAAVLVAWLTLCAGAAAASPVPSGFRAASVSVSGPRWWWIGGSIPCRLRHRCLALVRTADAGRSFRRVPLPRLADVEGNTDAPVQFADARDGYLYGTRFWVTHDGGRRWKPVDLGGQVQGVAAGGGFVYATVWTRARGLLMRSPVGRDDWTALAEAPLGFYGVAVDHGIVLTDEALPSGVEVLISHDQGAHFQFSRPLPEIACGPQEPVPGTVWMLCSGGMMDLLYRSDDGGVTFSQPDWDGDPRHVPALTLPNAARLGAATADTAVLGFQELLRTTDGGRTFRRVPLPIAEGGWRYVGFFDARRGLALGLFGQSVAPAGRLYYTADGGASYRRIPIR